MFDTEKIKKFINFDWKNMLDNTVPKNNSNTTFNDEEYDTIKNGSIIMLVASIVVALCSLFIATSITTSIININPNVSFQSTSFSYALIPLIILIYVNIEKDKKHGSLCEFILGILLLIKGIYSCISLISWVISMFVNPVWALLGLLFELASIYGIILVLNGLITFCTRANENVVKKPKTVKSKTKVKYCSSCGSEVSGLYCSSCGKKVK